MGVPTLKPNKCYNATYIIETSALYPGEILTVTMNVNNRKMNRNQISICVNAGLYVLNCNRFKLNREWNGIYPLQNNQTQMLLTKNRNSRI